MEKNVKAPFVDERLLNKIKLRNAGHNSDQHFLNMILQ